jgi:chromosomal replication initiation ATPase DnaA
MIPLTVPEIRRLRAAAFQRPNRPATPRGSLLLEGPAGIGKTRLVVAAGRRGRGLGLTALSARGSLVNQER